MYSINVDMALFQGLVDLVVLVRHAWTHGRHAVLLLGITCFVSIDGVVLEKSGRGQ